MVRSNAGGGAQLEAARLGSQELRSCLVVRTLTRYLPVLGGWRTQRQLGRFCRLHRARPGLHRSIELGGA